MAQNGSIPVHKLETHELWSLDDVPILQLAESAARTARYPLGQPHCHDYFEIYLTGEGHGLLGTEGGEQAIGPGSILVVPPGVVHSWIRPYDIDGFVVRIPVHTGYRFLPFTSDGRLLLLEAPPSHVHLSALLRWLGDASQGYSSDLNKHRWLLFCKALAAEASGSARAGQESEDQDLCASFLALLERRYRLRWGVQDYASALQVSRSKLLRCIQARLDTTPADLIRNRTLREAERLLQATQKSCSEISEDLGFLSQAQFTHAFQSGNGVSPSAFRVQCAAIDR